MPWFAVWFDPATGGASAALLPNPQPGTNSPAGPISPTRPSSTAHLCGVYRTAERTGDANTWEPRS